MRRPRPGNLRHRENNAARANAGYSAPAGRGLLSAADFDSLQDPCLAAVSAFTFDSLGPVSRNLLDACDDGALNLYDANGSPLLGNPSHHAAADVLAVHPSGRVALAVGRAGGACHAQPPPRSQQLSKASGVLAEGLLGMHYTCGLPGK